MAEVFEPKDMVGYLFKNDNVQNLENPNDYRGHCTIGGESYYINAWLNKNANGTYMRLVFKPKKETLPVLEEDIPF